MKKIVLIIVCVSLRFLAFNQQIVFVKDSIMNDYMKSGFSNKHFRPKGKSDKDNKKQGKWEDYEVRKDFEFIEVSNLPHRVTGYFLLYEEGNYLDDKKDGDWNFYVLEDKTFKKILQKKLHYKDGTKVNDYTYFFPNREIAQSGTYVNDYENRTTKSYFSNGKIYSLAHFIDAKRNGTDTGYFSNGYIRFRASYKDDSLDGEYISYYDNKNVKENFICKNGSMDGIYRYYYSNGQLWVERQYKDGLIMNITCSNAPDGKQRDKGTLKDGNGTVNFYTEEGKLYEVATYKDGKKIKSDSYGNFK